VLLVYPGSEEVLLVNLVHLEPKRRPIFPLDHGKQKDWKGKVREKGDGGTKTRKRRRTLVSAAQGLSISRDVDDADEDEDEEIDDGNVFSDDPDTDPESSSPDQGIDKTPVLNGREEVEPPSLDGWKIDIRSWGEQDEYGQGRERVQPALMNCALGMGGRVIVGVGSASSVWVWNLGLGE